MTTQSCVRSGLPTLVAQEEKFQDTALIVMKSLRLVPLEPAWVRALNRTVGGAISFYLHKTNDSVLHILCLILTLRRPRASIQSFAMEGTSQYPMELPPELNHRILNFLSPLQMVGFARTSHAALDLTHFNLTLRLVGLLRQQDTRSETGRYMQYFRNMFRKN